MLTEISTKGFKDGKFTQKLTGADIFTGVNGVRKSSRLEIATQLLPVGYLPNNGKGNTLESVLNFTTGNEIEVSGTFNNGASTHIKRIFRKNGMKKKQIVIDGETMDFTKGDAQIRKILGCLPLMVDISEFLNMSDNKKKEFLLQHSPEGIEWTKKDVLFVLEAELLAAKLAKGMLSGILAGSFDNKTLKELPDEEQDRLIGIITATLKANGSPDYPEAVAKVTNWISKKWNNSNDAQQNISGLIEYIKKERSHYDRRIKELKASDKTLTATSEKMGEAIASSINDVNQSLKTLQKNLTDIEKQITREEEKRKAVDKRDERIEAFKKEITRLKERQCPQVQSMEKELQVLKETKFPEEEQVNKQLTELKENLRKKEFSLKTIENELNKVNSEREAKEETLETISKYQGKCAISLDIECSTDLKPYAATLKKEIKELEDNVSPALNIKSASGKVILKINRQSHDIEQTLQTTQKLINNNQIEIVELQGKIDRVSDQQNRDKEDVVKFEKELSLLEEEAAKEPGLVDVSILSQQKRGIESRIEEKQKELNQLNEKKGLLIAALQMKINKLHDEVQLFIMKEAVKILGPEGLQGKIIEAIKAPLENEVNAILKEMNETMEFYIDLSDGFKMMWKENGKTKRFDTANDGHKVILITSFLTAIINRINPPLKILGIKAAEVGVVNFIGMLKGLAKIKESGRLDNVLAEYLVTLREDQLPQGWKQHVLV